MAREYKDSGIAWIGRIPKDWKTGKVSRFYSIQLGKMLQPNQVSKDDTLENYFCAINLGQNCIKYEPLKQMWFSKSDKIQYEVKKGDMLVVEGGDVASCDIVKRDVSNVYFQNAIHRVRPQKNNDIRILRYLLMTAKAKGQIELISNKATISHFTKEKFENLNIVLPPVDEQRAIASYLDRKCAEIDSLVELQEQMIAQLTDYKQSVITEAVTKGLNPEAELVPSGIDWIGDVPKGWKIARIKNVASLYGRIGFRGYTSEDLNKDGEGAITLSPSNMLPMGMDYSNVTYLSWAKYIESPEIMIQNNDLLMVKTGSSYGKVAYVDSLPKEATINPQILRIVPKISSKYLGYFMQTPIFLYQVEGGVVGGTIPTIAQEKISNFKTPCGDKCTKIC